MKILAVPALLRALIAVDGGKSERGHAPDRDGNDRRTIIRAHAVRPSAPFAIWALCLDADTIILGRVKGLIRQARTPIGSDSPSIHTVFSVTVERYLKSEGAPQEPSTIKVYQSGGTVGGTTYVQDDNPRLILGKRYVLFLRTTDTPQNRKQGGAYATYRGVRGLQAHLDEYGIVHPIRGKIQLEDGRTTVPTDPEVRVAPWVFEGTNETLIGLSEATAIELIVRGVEEAEQRWNRGSSP